MTTENRTADQLAAAQADHDRRMAEINKQAEKAQRARDKKAREAALVDLLTARDAGKPEIVEQDLRDQIGLGNVFAISGGRTIMVTPSTMRLPVSNGYAVEVTLEHSDLYTVRRTHTSRKGDTTIEGVQRGVFVDSVGESAYRASCFNNGPWGEPE